MKFSVVICTYDFNRIKDLDECVQSVLKQSYKNFELIVVVDNNPELFKIVYAKYHLEHACSKIILNTSCRGLSESMNYGVHHSEGDVVCFIDDDAVAHENWLKEMHDTYIEKDAYGVGGRIVPVWLCNEPDFIPREFQWLIGSTDSLYPSKVAEVRNFWSSNASFEKEVIVGFGPFLTGLGRQGRRLLQGEDAEYGIRILKHSSRGMFYNPRAIVYHKVYPERSRLKNLLRRAFEQGYSKSIISRLHSDCNPISVEKDYLSTLLRKVLLGYIKQILSGPCRSKAIKRIFFMLVAIFVVLAGFTIGLSER